MSRRQAKRNRELYLYYLKENEENGATYGDVGKHFGVCASRAFRIVKAEEKRLSRKQLERFQVPTAGY